MRNLSFILFLCMFCGATSVYGNTNNETNTATDVCIFQDIDPLEKGDQPLSLPPTLPSDGGKLRTLPMANAYQGLSYVKIVFLADSENAQVEICSSNGEYAYNNTLSVRANGELVVDIQDWAQDTYTINVKMYNGTRSIAFVFVK